MSMSDRLHYRAMFGHDGDHDIVEAAAHYAGMAAELGAEDEVAVDD